MPKTSGRGHTGQVLRTSPTPSIGKPPGMMPGAATLPGPGIAAYKPKAAVGPTVVPRVESARPPGAARLKATTLGKRGR